MSKCIQKSRILHSASSGSDFRVHGRGLDKKPCLFGSFLTLYDNVFNTDYDNDGDDDDDDDEDDDDDDDNDYY